MKGRQLEITNLFNTPQLIVDFVKQGNWRPNPKRISVTQLVGAPLPRTLLIKHWDDLKADAVDYFHRIMGTAAHTFMQDAAKGRDDVTTEGRVKVTFGSIKDGEYKSIILSGRYDWLEKKEDGKYKLTDVKVSSYMAFEKELKPEWIAQLNLYRWMLKVQDDIEVDELSIVGIARDWSQSKAGTQHPVSPFKEQTLPVWPYKKTAKYVADQLRDHLSSPGRECTPEEKWTTEDCFAVMKEGRGSAIAATDPQTKKPIASKAAAEQIIKKKGLQKDYEKGTVYIQERKGSARKCKFYCNVNSKCPFYVEN